MAQFLSDHIKLSTSEALDVIAALEDAYQVLDGTKWISVAMDVEQARALLTAKLFTESGE